MICVGPRLLLATRLASAGEDDPLMNIYKRLIRGGFDCHFINRQHLYTQIPLNGGSEASVVMLIRASPRLHLATTLSSTA